MLVKDFSMDLFNLDGKVAIVTGSSTGIGQAFAYALAKAGANIVITTHRNSADETVKLIESTGREAIVVKGDLNSKEDRKKLIDTTIEKFGTIDILVNNAGTIKRAPILEHPDEFFENVIDTNLKSVYYISRDVARIMKNNGSGKIINVASMLSFQGGKNVVGYTASKHGIAGVTKAFANELSEYNIQVNAIAPGYVITNNTKPILEDEKRKLEISSRIPIKKWAYPVDIAGAVVFLSSRASDYINGIILPVDGGWLSN